VSTRAVYPYSRATDSPLEFRRTVYYRRVGRTVMITRWYIYNNIINYNTTTQYTRRRRTRILMYNIIIYTVGRASRSTISTVAHWRGQPQPRDPAPTPRADENGFSILAAAETAGNAVSRDSILIEIYYICLRNRGS